MPGPGSETQFGPASIGMNTYVPVETHLASPMQLQPVNYNLLAQAGQNLGQQIMQGPLNPEVREKMRLGIASAKAGEAYLRMLQEDPERFAFLGAVQGDEYHTVAGANSGLPGRMFFGPRYGSGEDGSDVDPGTTPPKTDSAKADASRSPVVKDPGVVASDQGGYMGQPNPSQNPPNQPPGGVQKNLPEKTIPGQEGTPSESLGQAAPPPAPDQIQSALAATRVGGNAPLAASTDNQYLMARMMANRNQPVPPPAPVAPVQQPVAQPMTPSPQDMLSQWQAQTQTPPMTPDDALNWFRSHRSTLATGATYMAMGGPGGSPAFAFHMKMPGGKGGTTNIVPLSQMVQGGAGPEISAQNTSVAMSATGNNGDQIPAQPDMSQLGAYTNVPSAGGPAPQYMMASTAGAGAPAAPARRPSTDEPRVNQAPGINYGDGRYTVTSDPAATFAKDFDGQTPDQVQHYLNGLQPSGEKSVSGNPKIGNMGGYPWYKDERGIYYAARPASTNIWDEGRYYINSDGWHDFPLPQNYLRKNLAAWDPSLSPQQINSMSAGELQSRLETAYYINNILPHTTPASPRTQNTLDALRTQIMIGRRLLNATNGVDPTKYNSNAMEQNDAALAAAAKIPSEAAGGPGGIVGVKQRLGNWWQQIYAGGTKPNSLLNFLEQQNVQMHDAVGKTDHISDDEKLANFYSMPEMSSLGNTFWRPNFQMWLGDREKDFQRTVSQALKNNERVRPEDVEINQNLLSGKPIYDPQGIKAANYWGYGIRGATNQYEPNGAVAAERNRNMGKAAAGASPIPTPVSAGKPAATPAAAPTRITNQADYDALPPNTDYIGPDGYRRHKP